MNRHYVFVFIILALGAGVHSLEKDFRQICPSETICNQKHGIITYNSDNLEEYRKLLNWGKSWTITPNVNGSTTIVIVLKEFTLDGPVYVKALRSSGEDPYWEFVDAAKGRLEYMSEDIISLQVYIPSFLSGKIEAEYYVGCKIMIREFSTINFPIQVSDFESQNSCWIIKPVMVPNRRRIYFTLRDTVITEGSTLTMTDLYSSNEIMSVNSSVEYDIFGADTDGLETVMVKLNCSNAKDHICFGNIVSLSYYAITDEQVSCIEVQRECNLNPWMMSADVCERSCPALEMMLDEEVKKDSLPSARAGFTSSLDEENDDENKSNTGNKTPEKPLPKGLCTRKRYCRCPLHKKYCFTKRRCKRYGACVYTCIFMRVVACIKIKSTGRVKLL